MDTAQYSTSHQITATASFINLLEVSVNDFIGMTNNSAQDHLQQFTHGMLIWIHSVFPPLEVSVHHRPDPISKKKDQGEGTWETTKDIMGWIVDREKFTLKLMREKCE